MRVPGVGTYDLSEKSIVAGAQPAYSIGTGNRGPIKAKLNVPGPGEYVVEGKGKN